MADDIWSFGEGVPRALRPGERFAGRYDIRAELGRGGTATVYRAWDGAREVALKVPHAYLSAAGLERLRREAALAASLEHPGIVPLLGSGESEGRPFLVYGLVDGAPLSIAALRAMPPEASRARLMEVAEALGAAHAAGIVHRDLKPSNLLLGADGRLRLTDLGLAWLGDAERLTETGELAGTPRYMAPELVSKRGAIGPQADAWAFGVILYELLCGEEKSPFLARTVALTVTRILTEEPDFAALPADQPRLAALCRRCLNKDPRRRPADGAALAKALRGRGGWWSRLTGA